MTETIIPCPISFMSMSMNIPKWFLILELIQLYLPRWSHSPSKSSLSEPIFLALHHYPEWVCHTPMHMTVSSFPDKVCLPGELALIKTEPNYLRSDHIYLLVQATLCSFFPLLARDPHGVHDSIRNPPSLNNPSLVQLIYPNSFNDPFVFQFAWNSVPTIFWFLTCICEVYFIIWRL